MASRNALYLGTPVLGLLAIALTAAAYLSLVTGEERSQAFWIALLASCLIEAAVVAFLSFTISSQRDGKERDRAVDIRMSAVLLVWLLGALAFNGTAAMPTMGGSFLARHLVLLNCLAAFVAAAIVVLQYRQSAILSERDDQPQAERRVLESLGMRVDALQAQISSIVRDQPELAAQLQSLASRVETARTQLLSAGPSVDRANRPVSPSSVAAIDALLLDLEDSVGSLATPGSSPGQLIERARSNVDQIIDVLRQREDALTY